MKKQFGALFLSLVMVIGCSFIILYLNLTTMGYNFLEYVNFIIRRVECYFSIIGFIIMILSITLKGDYRK